MKTSILIHLHTEQRVVLCNNMMGHDRSVGIVTGRPNSYSRIHRRNPYFHLFHRFKALGPFESPVKGIKRLFLRM